ncbi:hypothetical protein IGI04_005808 [Brassica rapa subsp. trilocularis]|uniref:Alpha-taxilin n=1 Tax=Brassica rapa subsp. trilocularis TaxID=1813537 RepID=A0ABQ7NF40_BRACM|nr:hypothetical protein IGI04_005808 [Brassica rapa subsp. trilocularis]
MASNLLPEVDSLPDGFVDPEEANRTTTNNPTGDDVSIEKTKKPRTFPVPLCEEETYGNEDDLSKVSSLEQKEPSQTSSSQGSSQNSNKETESTQSIEPRKQEAVETKHKTSKNMFNSENDFLEFMLKYQQVLSERDSAITVRDKLESLCRELQRQNKMLMEESKRVSTEGQSLRSDLSTKFQEAIKDVSIKLDAQRDESLSQLKENEMLRTKLKHLADQYMLSEQQHEQRMKQKTLELQISELKIKQHEEKDALVKSNEVFETFKQEIDKMSKAIKELRKENAFLKSKTERSDFTLVELVEERERLKKLLEKTKNQKDKLESLCRFLQAQAERKQKQS